MWHGRRKTFFAKGAHHLLFNSLKKQKHENIRIMNTKSMIRICIFIKVKSFSWVLYMLHCYN